MDKCLTIVGRSKSAKSFGRTIIEPLIEILGEEDFSIEDIVYLGDFAELDGKSRFIAFVLVDDDSSKAMKIERLFSALTVDLEMGVRLFGSIADAKSYAEGNYSFNNPIPEGESQDENNEDEDEEDDERFPLFTAKEIEDFLLYESLFRTGKLTTVRGNVLGAPALVMAQIVHGPDSVRVTPYAVMINAELLENLELPSIDERD